MKNSVLDTYELLLDKSLGVSKLVSLASSKDTSFVPKFEQWLVETEELLEKNRIAQCSEIAGLRSKIINARYSDSTTTIKKRKYILSVATEIVYDAQHTLLSVLEPMKHRLDEARDGINQLLGVAYQADMINPDMNFNDMIQELWRTFSAHEQLKGLTSKILVYVNRTDALRILAEEVELLED